MPPPECPDTEFTESMIEEWATFLGCSVANAAYELGLGLSQAVVTIGDSSDQAKRNRNRAKGIIGTSGG